VTSTHLIVSSDTNKQHVIHHFCDLTATAPHFHLNRFSSTKTKQKKFIRILYMSVHAHFFTSRTQQTEQLSDCNVSWAACYCCRHHQL